MALMLTLLTPPKRVEIEVLGISFDKACAELAISMQSLDVWKREQIAEHILSMARNGECDVAVLQRQAVTRFKSLGDPVANA